MISEIWILEVIIIVLLAVPHIKSIAKPIHSVRTPVFSDGLSWLTFIALAIAVGIFPAYGFRPECLPILFFALIMCIGSLISFATRTISPAGEFYYNRKPVVSILALFFLVMTALPMFIFFPRHSEYIQFLTYDQVAAVTPDKIVKIENAGTEYFVRMYGISDETDYDDEVQQLERPLVFIVPPDMGSAASIDFVCTQLLINGYPIVTYFRKGYDSPLINDKGRKHLVSPGLLSRHWRNFRKAVDLASVNDKGKISEAERMADVDFLLSQLPSLLSGSGYSTRWPMVLVGYGAGGSALAYMAGDENFSSSHSNVLGTVAIESYLWSSYQNEERFAPEIPPSTRRTRMRNTFVQNIVQGFQRNWRSFSNSLNALKPFQVYRTGPLPGENGVSETQRRIPVLYLVSGRALVNNPKAQKPYQAVFDTLRDGSGPIAFAAIDSTGPLDYQDIPFTHPVMSFLLPGMKGVKKSENPVADTAGIINNWTSYLLEQTGMEFVIPPRQYIIGNVYVESKGLPAFGL